MSDKPRAKRQAAGVVLLACCLLTAAVSVALQWDWNDGKAKETVYHPMHRSVSVEPVKLPSGTIDVNLGDMDELTELPGVGETLAAYMIDEREKNGRFYYPEDLQAVKGIGRAKCDSIRDLLDLSWNEDYE